MKGPGYEEAPRNNEAGQAPEGRIMTPAEFAEAHSLSLEEARLILEKRNRPAPDPNSRLAMAREALVSAQKRVGVQPVRAEGEDLVKEYDPDADEGRVRFYEKQGRVESDPPKRFGDWEEPP
jgi:hypothetical protein